MFSRRDMRRLCVNHYTDVKKHVSLRECNDFPMLDMPTPPAVRYGKNLKTLLELRKMSVADVANAAKVQPKQIYNLMSASHDHRIKGMEKIANVFGLSAWQMLAVDFSESPAPIKQVLALLEAFSAAGEAEQAAIMQVALMASGKALPAA